MAIFYGTTIEEAIEKGLKELDLTKDKAHIQVIQAPSKGMFGFGKKDGQVSINPINDEVVMKANREAIRRVPEEIVEQCESVISAKEETIKLSQIGQTVKESAGEYSTERPSISRSSCSVLTKEADTPDYERLINLDEKTTVDELAKYLSNVTKAMGVPALIKMEHYDETYHYQLDTQHQGILIGKHGRILNSLQYLSQIFVHKVTRERISVIINVGDYRSRRHEILERLARSTALQARMSGHPVFLDPMPAYERKILHQTLSDDPCISTYSEGIDPYRYLVIEYKPRRI